MKTKKLLPLLFLACTQFAFGQITFQKLYEQISYCTYCTPDLTPADIKVTHDNGYIITGLIGDSIPPFVNPFLMKLDSNGDTLWTKYIMPGRFSDTLITTYNYSSISVSETCDSGFIIAWSGITRTDGNGNVLWSKQYPSIGAQSFAIRTNDCGYILASATDSFGTGGYDFYIIKTDTGGNPLWSRTYGGTGDDEATAIQQTTDGGYIIAGYSNSFGTSGYHAYLIKTDANGDTLWTKTYGQPLYVNIGYSVQQTFDHGYIILGGAYLIKTDSVGNVMWSKTLGGNSIRQTSDSGYIFIDNNILIKTNSEGNLLWAREFPGPPGGEGSRIGITVLQTNDGGYVEIDYTQLTALSGGAFYINLNKTDSSGQSGCNETNTTVNDSTVSITASGAPTIVTSPVTTAVDSSEIPVIEAIRPYTPCSNTGISERNSENSPIVYPNPVSPDGCLSIYLNEDLKGVEVTIYNLMGDVLYSEVANGTGQTILLSLKGRLSSGMYFLRIKQGENICVQKIVVMG